MKTFKALLLVTIIGSLIVCIGCPDLPPPPPIHFLKGGWEVTANSDVTPSDGIEDFEKGDWVGFTITIENEISQSDYGIANIPEGFEALWPLRSGDCLISDDEIAFYTTAIQSSGETIPLDGYQATYELNDDKTQITITRSTAFKSTGRIDGLLDPWKFILTKKE